MSAPIGPVPDPHEGTTSDAWLASFAALLAMMLIEVLDGHRSAGQLDRLVTPAVALRVRYWQRVVATRRRRRRPSTAAPPSVRSVRCQRQGDDAAESAVVIDHQGRSRAIAVRLDRCNGVWLATDLAPPEGGLPALSTSRLRLVPPPRDAFDETEEAGAGGDAEEEPDTDPLEHADAEEDPGGDPAV
jgi:hypothetical protein